MKIDSTKHDNGFFLSYNSLELLDFIHEIATI